MLARFLAWHAAAGRELVGVEVEFDATVGRALIRGKVDRLERDADGRLVVVDLKTGQDAGRRTPRSTGSSPPTRWPWPRAGSASTAACPGGAALLQVGTGAKAKEQHQEPLPADVPLAETWAGELLAEVGRGHGRGDLRGAHRHALPALPRPAQLPAPGARPAGDRMSRAAGRRTAVVRRPLRRRSPPSRSPRGGCSTPPRSPRAAGCPTRPSPEQARVVAAPPDRPLVVVAGAGSGKTETMAARVSWLVANRLVEPEAILGLTFTRKAASELNERVRLRLGRPRPAPRHRRRPAATGSTSPSRPSRPTTGTRPRWSPSTACGSAWSPAPACSGRRCAGAGRHRRHAPRPAT